MDDHTAALVQGVVDRGRTLLLTLDRQDRLESAGAFVGWLQDACDHGELDAPARELLLRAMKVAGDPVNYRILELLHPLDPVELPEIMEHTSLHRVAASERVNDLVQAGLAVRELINDQVRGTVFTQGIVGLVADVATRAGETMASELKSGPRR